MPASVDSRSTLSSVKLAPSRISRSVASSNRRSICSRRCWRVCSRLACGLRVTDGIWAAYPVSRHIDQTSCLGIWSWSASPRLEDPVTATSAPARAYDAIDLSSRAFWSTTAAERERSFAVLRAERPVSWHPPVEDALMPDPHDPGYWAVTRRADIVAVSRNNEVFLSGRGVIFENVRSEE